MESSSNDSFLWTDVSYDSDDSKNNKTVNSMETKCKKNADPNTNYKQKEYDENLGSENENKSKKLKLKKTKKRRCSEATQESSDYSQPERKRIKLEPESDMDTGKKKILIREGEEQDSGLYDEEYLNFKVKEEQTSLLHSEKKRKKKQSKSNLDNASQSGSAVEANGESYLELRVKQEEEASGMETEIVKPKKKKKKKHKGAVSSNVDDEIEAKVPVQDESTTEFSIIEEKFCAEDTVVQKPRKNKHKTNSMATYNSDDDDKSGHVKKVSQTATELDNDNMNSNDISLELNDFTCSNIVSSTILNTSAINLKNKPVNQSEKLFKKGKAVLPGKISDKIRFEEDDNSSQHESPVGRTSAKTNMFLKVNPHVKLSTLETTKDDLITENDEVWTLTWPHEINIEKLRNTTISSDGKCKIKIDGQTYEGVRNKDVTKVTLLTHKQSQAFITKLPVKECLDYHKRIPKVHIPNNNIMIDNQKNFTPLPETKCRHPLFGAHYKKAIKISTSVAERLQAATVRSSESPSETIKKKKHKKDKHRPADVKTEKNDVHIKPENETTSKKKKRKCSQEDDGPPKKSRCVNNNSDSPAVWESEKAIEENLFNF